MKTKYCFCAKCDESGGVEITAERSAPADIAIWLIKIILCCCAEMSPDDQTLFKRMMKKLIGEDTSWDLAEAFRGVKK